jgi:hypothetical protein
LERFEHREPEEEQEHGKVTTKSQILHLYFSPLPINHFQLPHSLLVSRIAG